MSVDVLNIHKMFSIFLFNNLNLSYVKVKFNFEYFGIIDNIIIIIIDNGDIYTAFMLCEILCMDYVSLSSQNPMRGLPSYCLGKDPEA